MKKGTRALNQAPVRSGRCSRVSGPSLAWREPSGGLSLGRMSDGRGQIPYMGPMWGQTREPREPSRVSVTPWHEFTCGQTRSEGCSKWTQFSGGEGRGGQLWPCGDTLSRPHRSTGTAGCQGRTCRLGLARVPGEAGWERRGWCSHRGLGPTLCTAVPRPEGSESPGIRGRDWARGGGRWSACSPPVVRALGWRGGNTFEET